MGRNGRRMMMMRAYLHSIALLEMDKVQLNVLQQQRENKTG